MGSRGLAASAILFLVGAVCVLGSEYSSGGWRLVNGGSGQASQMIYENPPTYLNIEQEFDINLNVSGEPTSGQIKFKSGFQRDMNSGEVPFYFDKYDGRHAVWEYWRSQGKILRATAGNSALSQDMMGKTVRVLVNSGTEYFGRVIDIHSEPNWFRLDIQGTSVRFENAVAQGIEYPRY